MIRVECGVIIGSLFHIYVKHFRRYRTANLSVSLCLCTLHALYDPRVLVTLSPASLYILSPHSWCVQQYIYVCVGPEAH